MSLSKDVMYVQTGCLALDRLLGGGFKRGELTLLYGEAATGKTNLVLQTSAQTARMGGKVVYVDADQSFTHQRFHQIGPDLQELSHNIIIFMPETFLDQTRTIESLEKYVTGSVNLIVVDAVTTLYRATPAATSVRFTLNRELNRQLAYLTSLARIHDVAVLASSQVHARLSSMFASIEPVAKRTLFHWPQTIIRLETTGKKSTKRIVIERFHSKNNPNMACYVTLTERGFE